MKQSRCRSRRRKHAFCTAAFVAAAALLTLAVNAGAIALSHSQGGCIDVSKEQYTVLTDETKAMLARLNKNIYLYYIGGDETDDLRVTTLLQNYAAASAHVAFSVVDPASHPGFTRYFDPDQKGIERGSVIVSDSNSMNEDAPSRYKVLSSRDLYTVSEPYYNEAGALVSDYRYFSAERKITAALDYILTGEKITAVFLAGQRETPPCGSFLSDLNGQYYVTRVSDLTDKPLDPKRDTLVVISPQTDLDDQTYAAIRSFLSQGGNAVFFMNMLRSGLGTNEHTLFDALLMELGLFAQRNVVVGEDPSFTYMSRINLSPQPYAESPITAPLLQEGQTPVLSYAGAILISEVPGVTTSKLLLTDATSFAKTSWTGLEKSSRQDADEAGPFVIGALSQKGKTAVVLYGSSSLVTDDENYNIPGNRQLLLNTIGVINGRQENGLIPMRTLFAASDDAYQINMTSEIEKGFYIGLTVVAIPLAVLLVGISNWVRRRQR